MKKNFNANSVLRIYNRSNISLPKCLPQIQIKPKINPIKNINHVHHNLAIKIQSFLKHPSFAQKVIAECLKQFSPSSRQATQQSNENKPVSYDQMYLNVQRQNIEFNMTKSQTVYVHSEIINKDISNSRNQNGKTRDICPTNLNIDKKPSIQTKDQKLQIQIRELNSINLKLQDELSIMTKKVKDLQEKIKLLNQQNLLVQEQSRIQTKQKENICQKTLQKYRHQAEKYLQQKQNLNKRLQQVEIYLKERQGQSIALYEALQRIMV